MKNFFKKYIPEKYKTLILKMLTPFEFIKYMYYKIKYKSLFNKEKINFQTDVETVNQIVNEKKSLSRFGDGEILWVLNIQHKSYQDSSIELANKLKEVLQNNNSNLLIGLPNVNDLENINKYVLKSRMHWTKFLVTRFQDFKKYINYKRGYADALICRCYIDYKEKIYAKERYANLKRIWDNKDIVIVEGTKTKMGVGNDLYENARSIKRIICPATNAFDKYDEIFNAIKELGKDKLIILALGPTATILASDICNLNHEKIEYQALDLGHMDIEYEWFLRKAKKRIAIEGKFVNEVRNKDLSSMKNDDDVEKYKNSIIKVIE